MNHAQICWVVLIRLIWQITKAHIWLTKHPSIELVDLPGAFNATSRTIQKVANIAIARHALRQISDLISRSAKSEPVIHATSTQSTSVHPSLYDRESTVNKTAFSATSAGEFSTAGYLDQTQSSNIRCSSTLSDSADEKPARRGGEEADKFRDPASKALNPVRLFNPSKQKLNNGAPNN